MINVKEIKKDFPILSRKVNGHDLVYLDNASTTQKPKIVIDALVNFYENHNANIHRGVHTLSEEATEMYEATRKTVADFISAGRAEEIVFVKNTTEAINLVAYSWAMNNIGAGDVICVSALEHHSNLVPWQIVCKKKQAVLRVIPINEDGTLKTDALEKYIDARTKLVAITAVSNALGTIVPLDKIIDLAHKNGAKVLVDGAQGVAHMPVNVRALDCDFLAFSAHKMLGPTGVGVLYAKSDILDSMEPFLYGGDMIKSVRPFDADWNDVPYKFEAGTPNIADVIAFGEAIKYLQKIGMNKILAHDQKLIKYAREKLSKFKNVKIYGPENVEEACGVLSFNVDGVHPHDVGSIMNNKGVAIRTGHHCTQPLMQRMKVDATARMSFYIYNDESDVDKAVDALEEVFKIFKL